MKNTGELIIYQPDATIQIEVRMEEETVWLTQAQMVELFQSSKQNISLHINNIFKEKELEEEATVKYSLTVQTEGTRTVKRRVAYYNLDVIISVGYRVKSQRGIHFRQWAIKILKDYLLKGYSINQRIERIENKLLEHDEKVLMLLTKRQPQVKATIYTAQLSKQLFLDLQQHNTQYPPIAIQQLKQSHDRFLIIDEKDIYHIGASLKDLGKKWFAFSKLNIDPNLLLQQIV